MATRPTSARTSGWPLPEGSYRIESIPYYVRGISKGDVIDVATQGARRFAKRLVEASGNSTIRIWTDDIDTSEYVMEQLRLRGCEVDNEHEPKLVAVSVPGEVEYSEILRWIAEGAGRRPLGLRRSLHRPRGSVAGSYLVWLPG
jgi:hypothetical protein